MKKIIIIALIFISLSVSNVKAETISGEVIHIDTATEQIITLDNDGFKAYDFEKNLLWETDFHYAQNYTIDPDNKIIYCFFASALYSVDYLNGNLETVVDYDDILNKFVSYYHNNDETIIIFSKYNSLVYADDLSNLWYDSVSFELFRLDADVMKVSINPNIDNIGVVYNYVNFSNQIIVMFLDDFTNEYVYYDLFDLSFLSEDPFFEPTGYNLKYASNDDTILMAVENSNGLKLLTYEYGDTEVKWDYLLFDEDSDGYIIDIDVYGYGYIITYYEDGLFNYLLVDFNNLIYKYNNTNISNIYFIEDHSINELSLSQTAIITELDTFFVGSYDLDIKRNVFNEDFNNNFTFDVDGNEINIELEPVRSISLFNIDLLIFKYNESINEFEFDYNNHTILFSTTDTYTSLNYIALGIVVVVFMTVILVRKNKNNEEDEEIYSYNNHKKEKDYLDY